MDYVDTTATLTLPTGSGPGTCDCVPIPIIDDFIFEDEETFSVVIQSIDSQNVPSQLTISPSTALVTITDNESENIILLYYSIILYYYCCENIVHACIPTHYYIYVYTLVMRLYTYA